MSEATDQRAALTIMRRFVRDHGGGGRVRRVGESYRWYAPNGREAAIGWVGRPS